MKCVNPSTGKLSFYLYFAYTRPEDARTYSHALLQRRQSEGAALYEAPKAVGGLMPC